MLLERGPLRVRGMTLDDVPLMAGWLSDPRVLEYYEGRDRPHDEAMVQAEYFNPERAGITQCIVEYEGQPIGFVQCEPVENEVGMDLFIGEPEYWDQGIGTEVVSAVAGHLFGQGAQKVTVDPEAWNTRAIRCYEKAGFRKVRLLPKHELHEGELRDCWLMERTV